MQFKTFHHMLFKPVLSFSLLSKLYNRFFSFLTVQRPIVSQGPGYAKPFPVLGQVVSQAALEPA